MSNLFNNPDNTNYTNPYINWVTTQIDIYTYNIPIRIRPSIHKELIINEFCNPMTTALFTEIDDKWEEYES